MLWFAQTRSRMNVGKIKIFSRMNVGEIKIRSACAALLQGVELKTGADNWPGLALLLA